MKNKHIMTIFAVAMLIYQGWRVFDYMGSSLTGVSDTVKLVVSIAFLSFSEIGLIIWLHVAQPGATTDMQETISSGMVWIDFVGSMIVGLGDMLKHNTVYVVDLTAIDPLLFLAPWLMVVLNIAGYLVFVQNDSDARLEREERRLQHEENGLEIEARRNAIEELRKNKKAIAEKLAPHYYRSINDRVTGRTIKRFEEKGKPEQQPTLLAHVPEPRSQPNGKAVYNAEAEVENPTTRRKG